MNGCSTQKGLNLSNSSTVFVFGASAKDAARRKAERQARRESGQVVYAKPVVVDFDGRLRVAQRSSTCPVCVCRVERGSMVRPAGWGRVAHPECMDAEVGKCRTKKSPVAAVYAVKRSTEARRRVFWAVECPECGSGSGRACVTPTGSRRTRNHVQRVLAYSAAKRKKLVVADEKALAELREANRALESHDDDSAYRFSLFDPEVEVFGSWGSEIEWCGLRV